MRRIIRRYAGFIQSHQALNVLPILNDVIEIGQIESLGFAHALFATLGGVEISFLEQGTRVFSVHDPAHDSQLIGPHSRILRRQHLHDVALNIFFGHDSSRFASSIKIATSVNGYNAGMDNLYQQALERFAQVFEQAGRSETTDSTAMTLATSDRAGRVTCRTVLLKGFDTSGFAFYTNITSRKGRQLVSNPRAALCFYWPAIQQQVTIDGSVTMVADAEADAYFATRPRESQIGAWASHQSRPLDNRETLEDRVRQLNRQYGDGPVPRPPHWTGFRLQPDRIEFWRMRPFRLHERVVYEKGERGWTTGLLYP
jgi:pyridoxamine 5'-phosphate oxidase